MPRQRCQGDPHDEPRSRLGVRDHQGRDGAEGQDHRLRPAQHRLQGRELLRLVRQHEGRQADGSGREGRDDGQGPARSRQEAGHRLPERRPDGQQLEALQERVLERPRSAHQERQGDQGP